MKLTLLALFVFAAADTSVDERLHALEQRMGQKIAALEAKLNATPVLPAGALLTFADGRTECPVGYAEPAHLKGRMMTTTPVNGTSGAVFHRPFDAGEIGRTPAHSHAVSVNDPGHTHVGIVNDPGHLHSLPFYRVQTGYGGGQNPTYDPHPDQFSTMVNKTGITVDNLPAKSAIEVSIDANDAGEHYPLIYVLLCQKLL